MAEPASSRHVFPDKKREPKSSSRCALLTPTGRPSGQMLARRMRSISGYSSGDEGTSSFRRMTSFGSATDSCNSLKFVVGTPLASEDGSNIGETPSHDMLMEMSREAEMEGRPPSPRPTTPKEKFLEHNKQLHVWDDRLTTTSPAVDNDFILARYRRSTSKNGPKALPKVTVLPQDSDETDF